MRPGQLRPGDPPGRHRSKPGQARFNEAGAASPRRLAASADRGSAPSWASMRPGQLRPGDETKARRRTGRARRASMRPGQLRPGDPPGDFAVAFGTPASMRPGQLRPGDSR